MTIAQTPSELRVFDQDQYLLKLQFFSFPHRKARIYDPQGNMIAYCKMRGFRLRESLTVYADETESKALMNISTNQIIDFSANYQITDAQSHEPVGSLARKGFSSLVRDSWKILDTQGQQIGEIKEDSTALAILRRFIEVASFFLPQKYHVSIEGLHLGTLKQHFNPFMLKLSIDYSADDQMVLDRRLGLAIAFVMCLIEGRQD